MLKKYKRVVLRFVAVFAISMFSTNINLYAQNYSLVFEPSKYTIQTFSLNGKEYKVRAYENIIYVAHPIDTNYQKLNIYVPDDFYTKGSVNGYNVNSAPIIFPNGIGGYMPSEPIYLNEKSNRNIFGQQSSGRASAGASSGSGGVEQRPPMGRMPQMPGDMQHGSLIKEALAKGYVVASAGARGRSLKNANGVNTGKAPAGLVDLKAAVKYLRFNSAYIPGDENKIISNGTSAGGAMSLLLGATGNSIDYLPYLQEIGAAPAPDNIFAVSAYCPITDLDHADAAYEWQFNGVNTYQARMMDMIDGVKPGYSTSNILTAEQIQTSNYLKFSFPIYLNSLLLTDDHNTMLTLSSDGEGNFKEYVKSFVIASAQRAVDIGKDISDKPWFTVKNGKVISLDFDKYIQNMQRMKTPPAFDAYDLSSPETHLFGTESLDAQHFTEFSYKNSPNGGTLADANIIKMMNPLYYIGVEGISTSPNWHIRYGTIDNNTSLAIEVIVATYLMNKGYNVDFEFAWDRPHMGDYDLPELFKWIDNLSKQRGNK